MRTIAVISLFSIVLFSNTVRASELSLREKIIKMDQVEMVWAIDEYHTVIRPKYNISHRFTDAFYSDFLSLLLKYGDLYLKADIKDPLTEKVKEGWVRLDIDCKGKYRVPFKTYDEYFLCEAKHLYKNKAVEIVNYYTHSRKRSSGGYDIVLKKITIKHSTSQPFLYKSCIVDKIGTNMPPEGNFNIKQFSRGFFKGYEIGDLVQYMIIMGREHGNPKYIIRATGWKEVPPIELFRYMMTKESDYQRFFFACGTKENPLVIKGKNGNFAVFHRTLDGIEYKPMAKR